MGRRRAVGFAAAVAILVITSCGSTEAVKKQPTSTPPSTPVPTTVPDTTSTSRPATTLPQPPTTPTTAAPRPATLVTRGNTTLNVVALTFDAGSDSGNAARILETLEANRIRATFGITGLWAQANPALVRQIAAGGNQIVDHSWDHRSFTGYSTRTAPLSTSQITDELTRTETLIRQLTGTGTGGWFRAPYGDRSPSVDSVAGAAGYRYDLMWTVDTLGWKGVSASTVVQRSLASASPGEIILMHVGSASTDAAALPELIASLRDRGYGFVTVSAMF